MEVELGVYVDISLSDWQPWLKYIVVLLGHVRGIREIGRENVSKMLNACVRRRIKVVKMSLGVTASHGGGLFGEMADETRRKFTAP